MITSTMTSSACRTARSRPCAFVRWSADPSFAVAVVDGAALEKLPGLIDRMRYFHEQRSDLAQLVSRWNDPGAGNRHLLSLARVFRMTKLLERMLDEKQFLSPHGIRALSRSYMDHPFVFDLQGFSTGVNYLPAELDFGRFGGNSNWRGPVWMPVNFLLVESLRRFHSYYGPGLTVEYPTARARSSPWKRSRTSCACGSSGSSSAVRTAAGRCTGTMPSCRPIRISGPDPVPRVFRRRYGPRPRRLSPDRLDRSRRKSHQSLRDQPSGDVIQRRARARSEGRGCH